MEKRLKFVGRKNELKRLSEFYRMQGAGFLHLRGRRRIGKSWLLIEYQTQAGGLYFQGEQDSTTKELQSTMAHLWDEYVGKKRLSIIRQRDLTWDRIFSDITEYAIQHAEQTILLIFDEIQWIAKKNSGFTSKIKNAWLSWEKTGNIKVIICGSSNKFFDDKTARESSVLRGLRTHSDIWVRPFSLSEVKQYFYPEWSHEEISLIYMMIGGIPYYLNRIIYTKNFINAINKSFFTRSTIFLDEIDEIINLEFNKSSKERIRALISALGQEGKTIANICRSTGISESSVRENIEKLVDYGLVFEKKPMGRPSKKNKAGTRYYMRDFYLNFYFQVLDGLSDQIKKNTKRNIFSSLLSSKIGYYIPNFSGLAFELLIESIIDRRADSTMHESIFSKLELLDNNYYFGYYWEQNSTQIDLIVESSVDRESRILEIKWIADKAGLADKYLEQVLQKAYTPPKGYRLSFYLVISKAPTKGLREAANKLNVRIVDLTDLF
jgi:AAA+ ATPase superfamily predicted ATPase